MNIFDKRPLSLILCITLGSFIFSERFGYFSLFIPAILLLLSFIRPVFKYFKARFLRIAALLSLVSAVFSFLYFNLWYDASNRYEGEATVVCTVTDIESTGKVRNMEVSCDNVNNSLFSSYDFIVKVDTDKYNNLSIGARLKIKGVIESSINEDFNGRIDEISELEIIEIGDFTPEYKLSSYRKSLSRKLILAIGKDSGGLLSAVLLGEKEYLNPRLSLEFKRIGLSHILALSGMHLAILALGFSRLLMALKINKKYSSIGTVAFTLFYVALTGFSVSVMRAGIMLIISTLLYLLSASHDNVTSLLISVSSLVIFNPNSINDLSLWLSAFATFGIIIMNEWLSEKYVKPSFLRNILISLLASLFAISATSFITVLNFKGISVISILTTLIFSLLFEIFIFLGVVLLLIGNLPPFNIITEYCGNLIIKLSSFFSGAEWVYVGANFIFIKICVIFFSLLFFVFAILKVRNKKPFILTLCTFLLLIFSTSLVLTLQRKEEHTLNYYDYNTQIILSTKDGITTVIDTGNHNAKTAYKAQSILLNDNVTYVDTYIYSSYSYSLCESVATLLKSVKIDKVYLPAPKNEDERDILYEILYVTKNFNTDLKLFADEEIESGNLKILLPYNAPLKDGKGSLFSIYDGGKIYTYCSASLLEKRESKNIALELIAKSDTIILGRYGSYNNKFKYQFENVEALIFSDEKMIDIYTLNHYANTNIYCNERKLNLIKR
jgi:ComEC/Rec2-related protein